MLTIVNNSDKVLVVKIINSIGQTIKNITLVDFENVNISEMESGVYFVISDNIRHKLVIK